MLRNFFILFLLFFIVHAQAQVLYSGQINNGSELHIKLTESHLPFLVSIDQRLYYSPDGYFSLGNLNGGNHDFKLYRYIPLSLNRIDSTLLICEGSLYIAPASRMLVILDPSKRFIISQYYNPLQYSMNTNLYNAINSKYFPIVPYDCLDSTSYLDLQQQLNEVPFNDMKLILIKESVFFHGIRAAQIKELMQVFPFDKDKIALAVFCYGCCVDKQNFNTIRDGFSFAQSSWLELRNQLVFYYNYGITYYKSGQ